MQGHDLHDKLWWHTRHGNDTTLPTRSAQNSVSVDCLVYMALKRARARRIYDPRSVGSQVYCSTSMDRLWILHSDKVQCGRSGLWIICTHDSVALALSVPSKG